MPFGSGFGLPSLEYMASSSAIASDGKGSWPRSGNLKLPLAFGREALDEERRRGRHVAVDAIGEVLLVSWQLHRCEVGGGVSVIGVGCRCGCALIQP